MKKLVYLIVVIVALGLIVSGCIPVVPPVEQDELGTLPTKSPGLSWTIVYPTSITVDGDSTVTIHVETDVDIDLHVCFKGEFTLLGDNYWKGHWAYKEIVKFLPVGTHNLSFTFTIPYDLYVESLAAPKFLAQNYYFYVFSTTPGGPWGTGPDNKGTLYYPAPDGENTDTITYPDVDKTLLLSTAIRMIKDKIIPPPGQEDTWTAGEELRESIVAKLDNASKMVSREKFNAAKGMMGAFINELESNNQAADWFKAGECVALAENIIEWIEVY